MIIVIKKADFETQPFSNLKTACKFYDFTYNTLVRKEFPIILDEYIIHQKTLIKSGRKNPNSANLLHQT